MHLSLDQLSYILERKYINIDIGVDVQLACTAQPPDEFGNHVLNNDAWITEWKLSYIPKPSYEDLEKWWGVLEEQYHSNPDRPDSQMHKYMHSSRVSKKPTIIINSEI